MKNEYIYLIMVKTTGLESKTRVAAGKKKKKSTTHLLLNPRLVSKDEEAVLNLE